MLEVLAVVVLLGVLASVVASSFSDAEKDSANTVFAHDARVAADVFSAYWLQHDFTFPADKAPGVFPPEMASYLGRMDWAAETPIGGLWDWDHNVFGVTAAVSVFNPDRTVAEMAEIDDIIDDGNLMTGNFRARDGGYMMVVKEISSQGSLEGGRGGPVARPSLAIQRPPVHPLVPARPQ